MTQDEYSEQGEWGKRDVTGRSLRVLVAGRLFAPEEVAGPVAVVIEGETIRAIWRDTNAEAARALVAAQMPGAAVAIADLGAWSLAPGYIDLHTHGFHGYDATTGTQEEIEGMARALPRTGVTSFFPTIATLMHAETLEQVQKGARAAENSRRGTGAEILGLRLEGPFISRARKGAQFAPGIRPPDAHELEELAALARGCLRIMDYAPEEDEDERLLAALVRLGIVACIGHTSATYEQACRAIDGGARHSTHLFNAMTPLEHRAPGVPGALLTERRVTVEIIADGIHLHPAITKLAIAARGTQDVALITDAVAPAGLAEGEFDFVGRTVTVCDGAVRMADGSLSGSVLALDQAVRNIVAFTGVGWSEAIGMASAVPARIAGLARRKGCVAPGADADLLALDDDGYVQAVWVRGQLAHQEHGRVGAAVGENGQE